MELVLIACCQRKAVGGVNEYVPSVNLISILSPSSYERLMDARRELANMLKLSPGIDLGSIKHEPNLRFLPAYKRYTGNVYSSSQIANLLPITKSLKGIIISALYGLLDVNDLIREYDLAMNDTLPNRPRLKTWWKRKGLGAIVEEYIQAVNPNDIHDLLSGHYRNALQPWPPNSLRKIIRMYSYPGKGIGSNWSRGSDLKTLLETHTDR